MVGPGYLVPLNGLTRLYSILEPCHRPRRHSLQFNIRNKRWNYFSFVLALAARRCRGVTPRLSTVADAGNNASCHTCKHAESCIMPSLFLNCIFFSWTAQLWGACEEDRTCCAPPRRVFPVRLSTARIGFSNFGSDAGGIRPAWRIWC